MMYSPTIIVADDSSSTRQTLVEIFGDSGINVFCAENGQNLLSLATAHHADLFIVDVNMPDIDGIVLTKKIREIPGYDSVPILILTALIQDELIADAFEAGANDFIQKPPNYFEIKSRSAKLMTLHSQQKRFHETFSDLKKRNALLVQSVKDQEHLIFQLREKLQLANEKLNYQLLHGSETEQKNSDLLRINQELNQHIKRLKSKNLELDILTQVKQKNLTTRGK